MSTKNEDCGFESIYHEKVKGIKKIDEDHAIYDDGSGEQIEIDKKTYEELYNSGQIEPSWDELDH